MKLKNYCRRKSMHEKGSITVVRCRLKIPLLGITVRHHLASLVMANSYPCDRIFNPHLTTIKDFYSIHTGSECRNHDSFSLPFKIQQIMTFTCIKWNNLTLAGFFNLVIWYLLNIEITFGLAPCQLQSKKKLFYANFAINQVLFISDKH